MTRPPSSVRRVNLDRVTWPKLAGRLADSGLVTVEELIPALFSTPVNEKGVPGLGNGMSTDGNCSKSKPI